MKRNQTLPICAVDRETPRIMFLHYWGVGRTDDLANTLKQALNKTKP
jgi:hypothetical protein